MGMDIYAIEPTGKAPNYFRANIWGWSQLGGYVADVAPSVQALVGSAWWFNDGVPIDEEACQRIAAEVRAHIEQHGLPEQPKVNENPTGQFANGIVQALTGSTTRVIDMTENNYVTQRLEEFLLFLENSGGIEIC